MSAGTLKLTNNSTAVVGTSTVFTTDLKPGDFITVTIGGVLYTLPVDTVTSNTAATLVSAFTGPTTTGAAWAAVPRKVQNQVTAELVNQSTAAIRALLAEKGNWASFYTAPGDITMQFADNVAPVSGPGWQKMAGLVGSSQQWRGNLPAAANLKSYGPTTDFTGTWNRSSNVNTTTAYGFPEDNGQGILEVYPGGRYGGMQRYTVSMNGNVYVRSLTGAWNGVDGPWGEWSLCGVNTRPGIYSGDLNLLVTPGVWSVGDSNTGTTNAPSVFGQTTSNGICEVILRNAGNTVLQRFTTMTSSATTYNYTWQRTLYGTTWSPWELIGKKALNDLGLGWSAITTLSSFDWQQFDAMSGQICRVAIENMTNLPPGITFTNGTGVYVLVNGTSSGGSRFSLEVIPDTTTDSNYKIYKVLVVGTKGGRTFSVRQVFTSTDVVPIDNGGTGATTAAAARTALGVGYGTVAGTVAQGNDSRMNTINGKSGGTIVGGIYVRGDSPVATPAAGTETATPLFDAGWSTGVYSQVHVAFHGSVVQGSGSRAIIAIQTSLTGNYTRYLFDQAGNATAPGSWIPTSDERIKDLDGPIADPLDKMRLLRGQTWKLKENGQFGIGFTAQDAMKAFPEAVRVIGNKTLPDGTDVPGVLAPDTYGISAALHHEAILALMDKIESQQAEIEALKSNVEELKKMVDG